MIKSKIAMCLTTFLNDNSLACSVASILNNWNMKYMLLIGDQCPSDEKANVYSNFMYYDLPYDCGLSYSRNFLVQKAKELNCDYCLITADNIYFTQQYDFSPIIDFLESDPNNGIVGLNISYRWMYNLSIENKEWKLIPNVELKRYKEIDYYRYDLIPNFFIAKIQCLLDNKWDDNLKMSEHLDFFWRLKINTNYKVYYTNYINAKRIPCREGDYGKMRQRHLTNEFRSLAWAKYGLTKGHA